MLEMMLGIGKRGLYLPDSGPGNKYLIAGDETLGYFGEVSASLLMDTADIIALTGVQSGAVITPSGLRWFKFIRQGTIIYYAKTQIKGTMLWNDIYLGGAVYGTNNNGAWPSTNTPTNQLKQKVITEDERSWTVKLRLPRGFNAERYNADNPSAAIVGSEWNELMYRVVIGGHANAGEWAKNTLPEVGSNGYWDLCMETPQQSADWAGVRGENDITRAAYAYKYGTNSGIRWRPVLELIIPKVWSKLLNMSTARMHHASVGHGDLVYIAGGLVGLTRLGDLISYNTKTQQYTTLTPMPVGRYQFKMAVIAGKIYAHAGSLSTGLGDSLHCYDIALGTWSVLSPPLVPSGRREGTLVAYNGKLYAAGGYTSGDPAASKELWSYDTVANAWTRLADLPTVVYGGYFCVLKNYLYYCGGREGTSKEVYRFDPSAGAQGNWIRLGDMPVALLDAASCVVNDVLYTFGGITTATINTVYSFDGSVWEQVALVGPPPSARYSSAMALANGALYVSGGNASAGGITSEMWRITV